jgi:hypothetical protein
MPLLAFLGKWLVCLPPSYTWLAGVAKPHFVIFPIIKPHSFSIFAMCSALTLLIATVSGYSYESPLNSLKRYFMDPRSLTADRTPELNRDTYVNQRIATFGPSGSTS